MLQFVPKLAFIVPYRDREQQFTLFKRHMTYILEDFDPNEYLVFFIHQCDNRSFNRGALKNIGFLIIRELFPSDYRDITLVFNDIDTMPYMKNFLNYHTTLGSIKHFYGVKSTLGGIVSITAADFEKMGGFPNFWSWGFEDNALQDRAEKYNIHVDRNEFYQIGDKNIIQLVEGLKRWINRTEIIRYTKNTPEGWHTIKALKYILDIDNRFVVANINDFMTGNEENITKIEEIDIMKSNIYIEAPRSKTGNRFNMFTK